MPSFPTADSHQCNACAANGNFGFWRLLTQIGKKSWSKYEAPSDTSGKSAEPLLEICR